MAKISFKYKKLVFAWIVCTACGFIASETRGQRPRFPDFFQNQPLQTPVPSIPGSGAVFPTGFPQGGPIQAPPATIIVPPFDPFSSTTQTLPFNTAPPINAANTVPGLSFPAPQNLQVLPPQQFPNQIPQQHPNQFQPYGLQPPQFQQPFFQNNQQFPRTGQTGSFFRRFQDEFLPRLLERPRFRHTFLAGGNGNELQINDLEFATTLTFPRFLFSQQPVRITPGFIAHFWDGPDTLGPFGTGFDLPEKAFSAFLTMEHFSDPNQSFGIETNLTVGVYSDYNHLDSDSLRVTGVGLGWWRLNETNILKFGAEYLDRIEVKLLPAFGLFVRPTQDVQIDLYFPRPRIAQRLPNFRNFQTWGYVSGEYGGGSWTVERIGGFDDQIDINDFRAMVGVEWVGQRGVTGFVETGYVFDRELISKAAVPARRLELEDTIMVRLGLEF